MFVEETKTYDYVTAEVLLATGDALGNTKISIPDGKVVAMGVENSMTEAEGTRFINLSVLDNGNDVIHPADYRFSKRVAGITFKESLRPVNFNGGKTYDLRLTAATLGATDVALQVMFMIEKPQ